MRRAGSSRHSMRDMRYVRLEGATEETRMVSAFPPRTTAE